MNNKVEVRANLWKYFLASALNSMWFIMPISILYLQFFGLSFLQIGLLYGISVIIVIILIIPAGALVDMIGKKWASVIGSLFWSVGLFLIGIGSDFYVFLIGYIFYYGLSEVLFTSAFNALLYDTLIKTNEEDKYLKINGKLVLLGSILLIISSLLGVILFNINKRLPFLAFSGVIFLSAIVILFMKEPIIPKKEFSIKTQVSLIKSGFKNTLKNRNVRFLLICSIVLTIPISIFLTLMEQPYVMSLGFNLGSLGLVFALTRGLMGVMSGFSNSLERRLGERNSFYFIIIIYSIAFVLIGLFNSPIMLICLICLAFIREYSMLLLMKYVNENVDSSQRATILSIQNFYINIFYSIALIIAGFSLTYFAMNIVLVMMGISTFVIAMPYIRAAYSK